MSTLSELLSGSQKCLVCRRHTREPVLVHVAGPVSIVACPKHVQLVELGVFGVRVGGGQMWERNGPAVLGWLSRVRARLGR